MINNFDGIGLNSGTEAELREGISREAMARHRKGRQDKILTEDNDFNFNS